MKKRIVSILLTLAMLVGIMSVLPITIGAASNVWDGTTTDTDFAGTGSSDDPYQISSAEELAGLASLVDASPSAQYGVYYKLTADIYLNDVSDYGNWTSSTTGLNQWEPIGTGVSDNKGFNGNLDGAGHTIYGLYYSGSDAGVGLFTQIDGGGSVTNLRIVDSYVYSTGAQVGVLAACTRVSTSGGSTVNVKNIYVEAFVHGNGSVGGVVGIVGGSTTLNIDSCVFAGTVKSTETCAAGIVGNGNGKTPIISNCINLGSISGSGKAYICGIMGRCDSSTAKVTYCINLGSLVGSNPREISMSYYDSKKITVNNCYGSLSNVQLGKNVTLDVTDGASVNDITADSLKSELPFESDSWSQISGDYYLPKTVSDLGWGYLTRQFTVIFKDENGSVYDTKTYTRGAAIDVTVPSKAETTTATYEGSWKPDITTVSSNIVCTASYVEVPKNVLEGSGEESTPYLISDLEDMKTFLAWLVTDFSTYRSLCYKLMADIDVSNIDWTPIQGTDDGATGNGFTGTFDGNGHAISGLKYNGDAAYVGFFGNIEAGATVKNLAIKNATITTTNTSGAAGGLAGVARLGQSGETITVSNVYVDAVINTEKGQSGGLIGHVGSGKNSPKLAVDSCVFSGSLTSTGSIAGGIVGNGNGSAVQISNCLNLGDIVGTSYVAGMLGRQDKASTITNCINLGVVTGTYARAIVSASADSSLMTVSNCYGIDESLTLTKNANATNCSNVSFDALMKVIPDGFTNWTIENTDICIPTGVKELVPADIIEYRGTLTNGASVRLAATSPGLRFEGTVGKAWLEAKGYTVYMLIAPTDYITTSGDFTMAELDTLNVTTKYKLVEITQYQNDYGTDGYYNFTVALAVADGHYNKAFSARLVFKDANGTYTYGSYDANLNSRTISEVSAKALADTSTTSDELVYKHDMGNGIYSCYSASQRAILQSFAGLTATTTNIKVMTFNVKGANDGLNFTTVNANGETSEDSNTTALQNSGNGTLLVQMLNTYGIDVAALQEVGYDMDTWSGDSTGNGHWRGYFEGSGFANNGTYDWTYANDNELTDNKYSQVNAVVYNKLKFEIVDKGAFALTRTDSGENLRRATWVLFREKGTGAYFMFVSTHLAAAKTEREAQTASLVDGIQAQRIAMEAAYNITDLAVVLAGDMNNDYDGTAYKNILAGGDTYNDAMTMVDGFDSTAVVPTSGGPYTYEDGASELTYDGSGSDDHIDHIFVGKNVSVSSYDVINTDSNLGGNYQYMSDHAAVWSAISFLSIGATASTNN